MKIKSLSIVAVLVLVMSIGLVRAVDINDEQGADAAAEANPGTSGQSFLLLINQQGNCPVGKFIDFLTNRLQEAGHTLSFQSDSSIACIRLVSL